MRRMETTETLLPHIRAILAEWDRRADLLRVERPDTGISSTVLFLTTTRGEVVLRIAADAWKIEKEATLFSHMRSLGVPVPEILHLDTSRRIAPFTWSLATRLAGVPFSTVHASLDDDTKTRIYHPLGDALGKLHATTFTQFGDSVGGTDGLRVGPARELDTGQPAPRLGPFATWRQMHDEIVRSRLHLMRDSPFKDLVPAIEAWFETHDDLLDGKIVPRLLHMDLHQGNILIEDGDISGILDIEESIVGHNEYDLMRTELAHFRGGNPRSADAFMRSYRELVTLDAGYEERRQFYDLSRSLTWIRSLIDHGEGYVRGMASQTEDAARAQVLALVSAGS